MLVFIFYKTEFKTCVQLLFLTEKIRVHRVERVEIMRVERVKGEERGNGESSKEDVESNLLGCIEELQKKRYRRKVPTWNIS